MLSQDPRNDLPPSGGTWFAPAGRATHEHLAATADAACRNPVVDAVLTAVGCVVAVLNEQRQIVAVNDALMRYLGVSDASKVLGLRVGEALHCVNATGGPDGCGTARGCSTCGAALSILLAQSTGQAQERECLICLADGAQMAVELRARAVPMALDGHALLLLLLQDIRDEKRRQALERVFFHDVRNTLTGLLGGADLLEGALPEQMPALVALVQSSARQLAEEIEGQRVLALTEAGDYRVVPADGRASAFLAEASALLAASPAGAGRTLRVEPPDPDLALRTDAVLLRRVLVNMVKNALEATPPGGTVRLSATPDGSDGVRWDCWNTGCIPLNVATRIFQRSFSTKGEGGRGLGTFGMRLLAERYLGGHVDFHSTTAEGTTFTLHIPRALPWRGLPAMLPSARARGGPRRNPMKDWSDLAPMPPRERRLWCNRTLNLKSLRAIGYDMDYTLIHYRVDAWERRAYEHLKRLLGDRGIPVEGLEFDPEAAIRGLAIDKERGNLVKANRFGYVKQAAHGTRPMPFDALREAYGRTVVDLSEARWEFLNTFFSQSEGCMYAQLVDRLDEGRLPGVLGYGDLYRLVRRTLDFAHLEGRLKAEIIGDPDAFVDLDPELPQALADQRLAGRKVLLITNSEWPYTSAMMTYAFDRFLPEGKTWRDLFDMVFVSARKPAFFTSRMPVFEVASEDGLLRPVTALHDGGLFLGGDARLVEEFLGVSGEEILYVGDHLFTDVHVSKEVLRWRTALVARELEEEIAAQEAFRGHEQQIETLMAEKERLEHLHAHARLGLQRLKAGGPRPPVAPARLHEALNDLRAALDALDERIGPLAQAAAGVGHRRWGPLMRAGNDKSLWARQVERYADVYTSRVSNFLAHTPYGYLRSFRGDLPHDA